MEGIKRENLDNCKEIEIESSGISGTRYKLWLEKEGKEILFKESKEHAGGEDTYEDISEVISYKIGKILEINVVETGLGTYNGHNGSYSYKINNLVELSAIICNEELNYDKNHPFEKINYNFDYVEKFFYNKEEFYNLIIFDYIRAEVDRHPSNIGFKNNMLSPIYDNGNSFGSFLYEDELENEIRRIATLCYKTYKSSIGTKSERPALWNNVVTTYRDKLVNAIKNVLNKEKELLNLFDNIAIDRLSTQRKELMKAIITYKIDYLKKI